MTLTHIFVDFDNLKPSAEDIALARGDHVRLAIVRGPQATRYEADLAEALHAMGERVSFTRCAKAGKNAADMQIAFHLGELVSTLPAQAHRSTRFIVISKDKGFDPLLAYLHDKGFEATRVASLKAALSKGGEAAESKTAKTRAPAAKAAKKAAPKKSVKKTAAEPTAKRAARVTARPETPDAAAKVIESLRRMGEKRPAKRKGLARHIESHLGRNLAPDQIEALLTQLERDGVLVFTDNKVEYRLPKPKK